MAQRTDFSAMACSIARTWAVIGEPWSPLILRNITVGLCRFDQIRTDLGVAPNVLTDRLNTLEASGVVERVPYKDGGRTRYEYRLTEMGQELVPVLIAITNWGDKWVSANRPPATFTHHTCGTREIRAGVVCSACGEPLTFDNTTAHSGPGARKGPGTKLIAP